MLYFRGGGSAAHNSLSQRRSQALCRPYLVCYLHSFHRNETELQSLGRTGSEHTCHHSANGGQKLFMLFQSTILQNSIMCHESK